MHFAKGDDRSLLKDCTWVWIKRGVVTLRFWLSERKDGCNWDRLRCGRLGEERK